MLDLTKLTTETRNDKTMNLDQMTPAELAAVMNEEDGNVVKAVKEVIPEIATAIEWATESLNRGGRIIYMGAGTSGRLGVLDAVECPPTFGVSPDLVVGLIAGGEGAFVKAVEGAEDSQTLGVQELKDLALNKNDIVIGLAASGRTPYVIHGLAYADSIGCKTVAIAQPAVRCRKGRAACYRAGNRPGGPDRFHKAEGRYRPENGSEYDINRQYGGIRKGISESHGGCSADQ